MPEPGGQPVYQTGEWEIDLARREVRARGVSVPIGGRAFEIMEVLVRAAGDLVTKNELMDRIWPGAVVGDNTLQVHISAVRKALGPYGAMLKTVSGRGYRMLENWTVRHHDSPTPLTNRRPISENPEPAATNFPMNITALNGRSAATRRLRDLVSAWRVVTLTGPGGIGKTALALEVAGGLLADFDGGGWFVELASLSDPDLVPSAIARVMGLKLTGETISAEAIARAIGGQNLLLVLDNCEHVIDAVATVTEMLVRSCPRTTILTTSREVLRIDGEFVYRVPPLEVPAAATRNPDRILEHGAVELFVARTKALLSGFAANAEDLAAIAMICRRLDGIPLAIEFAAARAATLGIQPVAARLDDRFALLTGGRRTALPRHRTLRATLDWSFELLPSAERLLLRRLAVFAGGFPLAAAVAVMGHTDAAMPSVLHGLASLVNKSLVVFDASAPTDRWRLLETIRAYALEKLIESGEADDARRRHAAYFRDLFTPEGGVETRLSGEDLALRLQEIDNVRAALDWSFSPSGDAEIGRDLTAAYGPVWLHLSLVAECRERCERALLDLKSDESSNPRRQMRLHTALGSALLGTMGPGEQTEATLTKALEIAEQLGDLHVQARVLLSLSAVRVFRGEYGEARIAVERFRQVAYRIGDPAIIFAAERRMGETLLTIGRPDEARLCFERILQHPVSPANLQRTIFYQLDDRALSRAMMARALCLLGFMERARREAQASLDELHGTAHQLSFCRVIYYGMCRIALMTRDLATAEQAVKRFIEVVTGLNAPFWHLVGRFLEGKLMVERRDFARGVEVLCDAFETCRRTGWRASYPEFMGALAEGLAGIGRLGDALDAVNDAIANAGEGANGQVWYVPELLRIKGELLLRRVEDQSTSAAEDCFNEAAEMAREQGALLWELRVALSLARVRVTQGRQRDARRQLASAYDRFTEGFETADLRAARAMLDALPS